jgi:hypothetical protein
MSCHTRSRSTSSVSSSRWNTQPRSALCEPYITCGTHRKWHPVSPGNCMRGQLTVVGGRVVNRDSCRMEAKRFSLRLNDIYVKSAKRDRHVSYLRQARIIRGSMNEARV